MNSVTRTLLIAFIAFSLIQLPAQTASDDQIQKALEVLRQTEAPGSASPPPASVTVNESPSPAASPESAEPPPPSSTPEPPAPAAVDPVPADPSNPSGKIAAPISAEQEQQLKDLLEAYRSDRITVVDYQKERAKILGRTYGEIKAKPARKRPVKPVEQAATPLTPPTPGQPEPTAPAPSPARPLVPAGPALDAALVPGADLVLRLDWGALQQAPAYQNLRQVQMAAAKQGLESALPMNADFNKKIEDTLGLKDEDLEHMILSADLDGVQMSLLGPDANSMDSIKGLMAVQVAKDVTLPQLKQLIQSLATSEELEFKEEKSGDIDLLSVFSKEEGEPPLHLAVVNGKTIYAAFNRSSVAEALDRANGQSQPARLESSMAGVMKSLPSSSQMKFSFVVPQSLKEMLKSMSAAPQGGSDPASDAGPAAMLSGFNDIKSLSLGLSLSEGLALILAGDLGSAEAANGLNMLLSLMLPDLKASLAQQIGKRPEQLARDTVTTSINKSVLQIKMSFNKDMLTALSAQK